MSSQNVRYRPYRHSSTFYRKIKQKKLDTVQSSDGSKQQSQSENNVLCETTNDSGLEQQINITLDEMNVLDDDCFIEGHITPEEDDFDKIEFETLSRKLSLMDDLRNWALLYKVRLDTTRELLKILRNHGMTDLPRDARTLVKTPVNVVVNNMGTGKFWYNGIETNLVQQLSEIKSVPTKISLLFNIDGMSPFKSSSHQFWPISLLIDELRNIVPPLIIAIYYGDSKPPLQAYLTQFVDELNILIENGLLVNKKKIEVHVKCFVCDTQARSFIKGTPGCNAENGSCIKCTVTGEWDKNGRHMSYPRVHCPRRTDKSFREKSDEDHHKEETPLTLLPVDMVEDFVVADSLHLFDLGIMRRCLYGWREGSYNFRTKLSTAQADQLSEMLEQCNQAKPVDIQRAIRRLKYLKFWKGSEYRVFLLYLGMVVLKDFLSREVYEHFLILSCAVTILSCQEYFKYISIAKKLLEDYIELFIELYGIDSISSNVHNLCHVVEDVTKFGPLPGISSYPFENLLGNLKLLVRNGNLPLSQISKRIIELSQLSHKNLLKQNAVFAKKANEKEKHNIKSCNGVYKELVLHENFILKADDKNSFFMTKSKDIIVMINATYHEDKFKIYGVKVEKVYDYFAIPFKSSNLNIFATKLDQNAKYHCKTEFPKLYSLREIKCKLFRLQYHDEFVFIPLIHTLDIRFHS